MNQKIYIVDDDSGVRNALTFLLDSVELDSQAYESAQSFLDQYEGDSGVLVLDVRMPGMSGLELQEALNERQYKQLAIIFISGHGDIPMAVEALKRGAVDFITKPFRDQELLDRIHEALEQNAAEQVHQSEARDIQSRLGSLSPRETEVMNLVADGKANKVIAFDLGISQRTVEIHRAHVMEKMQVRSLAQLVRLLHTVGYFDG